MQTAALSMEAQPDPRSAAESGAAPMDVDLTSAVLAAEPAVLAATGASDDTSTSASPDAVVSGQGPASLLAPADPAAVTVFNTAEPVHPIAAAAGSESGGGSLAKVARMDIGGGEGEHGEDNESSSSSAAAAATASPNNNVEGVAQEGVPKGPGTGSGQGGRRGRGGRSGVQVEGRRVGTSDPWVSYRTQTDAARKLNISQSYISSCVNGKTDSTGGYEFRRSSSSSSASSSRGEGGSSRGRGRGGKRHASSFFSYI